MADIRHRYLSRFLPFLSAAWVGLLPAESSALSPASAIGICGFDQATLSFAGDAVTQAACLLRFVEPFGHVGPARPLPPTLLALVGKPVQLSNAQVAAIVRAAESPDIRALAATLDKPVSRARNNAPTAPLARYFVIHDTSSPNLGAINHFPTDIDTSKKVNSFAPYPTGDKAKAHFFVNRRGDVQQFVDFGTPWRATKLELNVVKIPAKGLFLHIENIQPRRNNSAGIDVFAPDLGFTDSQYHSLALLYLVASRRAGNWMIPAFHGLVDAELAGAHDDPQRFDIGRFDSALANLVASGTPLQPVAAAPAPDSAVTATVPLRASLYYTALQSDYPAGTDAAFRTRDGALLARASSQFVSKAAIEGSAKLSDGRMLNVDGKVAGESRWRVITNAYGLDAVGCPLVPFRSAAVDRNKVPLQTKLFIPETVGMPLPDGATHDGTWYAVDTGSAILADRIDLFLGAGKASMDIPRQHGIGHLQALQVRTLKKITGCDRPAG